MRLRILNHFMVPFCRYRTIARLSGRFVLGKTFECERAKGLVERAAMHETFRVRVRNGDLQGLL